MRPPTPTGADPQQASGAAYLAALGGLAAQHGITRTGVAPAGVLQRARRELHRRAAAGLADEMAFTYRNPERSTDPGVAVAGAAAVFVGARPYVAVDPVRPSGVTGRVARYAWDDHVGALRDGLWAVAGRLRDDGWKAVAYADDNSIVDREVAYLAGLGWFGKSANLLVPGAGSWFVLGCVVTTAPLPVNVLPLADGCGACRRCLDGCPTQAIVEPGVVDARRCLSWLLQKPGIIEPRWRVPIGDRLYGCDDCQEVCPPSVRGGRTTVSKVPVEAAYVDVLALLEAGDEDVLAGWGRRYLAERDPRWARRNALVVLGNAAPFDDPRVADVLARYTAAADPVLRVHAVWAARRLGLTALVPAVADEPDPVVRAELAQPVEPRATR